MRRRFPLRLRFEFNRICNNLRIYSFAGLRCGITGIIILGMKDNESTYTLNDNDLAEIKDLDRKLADAFGQKDLDALMDCFWNNPNLVVVLNGKVHCGVDTVRTTVKEMFEQNEWIRLTVDEVTHLQSGDGVVGVGTATFKLKPVGGSPRLMVERWSDLRRKIDGRWVYVHDHTTVLSE
jgi:uncharacterized protein (TIGR02246 family)